MMLNSSSIVFASVPISLDKSLLPVPQTPLPSSNTLPPPGPLPLTFYLHSICSFRTVDVALVTAISLHLHPPLTQSNLSSQELAALHALRSNPDFVIKPADRGCAIVAWRSDLYIAEAECQLSDTYFYLPLDHGPTIEHQAIVRGVAMGTHMGPSFASLFAGYMEHSLFQFNSGHHPLLFLWYIDDIIGIASFSRNELEKFIDFASNFHSTLTFTWSISDSSLPFLNISVSIS
eukprot:g41141.t1